MREPVGVEWWKSLKEKMPLSKERSGCKRRADCRRRRGFFGGLLGEAEVGGGRRLRWVGSVGGLTGGGLGYAPVD